MFNETFLDIRLAPLGYRTKSTIVEEEEFLSIFNINVKGRNKKSQPVDIDISLCIPKLDKTYNRIIQVEGSSGTRHRIIAHQARHLPSDNLFKPDISVTHWMLTVVNAINDIMSDSLMDLHFSGDAPSETLVDQRFQNWLNTSPHIFDVDPSDYMKVTSYSEALVFDVEDEMMSHNGRVFNPDWLYKIDPTSTSTSNKINKTYRLAKGAKIVDGQIVPGKHIFCSTIIDNSIYHKYNPRRSYLLRTTFENSVPLIGHEEPLIRPEDSTISGVHMYTAIMHHGLGTYEDAIAVSSEAALEFLCSVTKKITFRSRKEILLKVKENDTVSPGQLLAVSSDSQTNCYASKIYKDSLVEKIESYRVMHNGYMHNAVRFYLTANYPLEDGDKISNRGATKGVVNIVDVNDMPHDEYGVPIDVCISPEAVIGRRVLSLYMEMMASAYYSEYGNLPTDDLGFEDLAKEFGDKNQLYINDKPLDNLTYTGTIYWLRLNKHAIENISSVNQKRLYSIDGTHVDNARSNGQRIDISKTIAFHDRNMDFILDDTIDKNSNAYNLLRKYMKSLLGK
jgi:hypothetical protein